MSDSNTPISPQQAFIRWFLWQQWMNNSLWSVAIEYPALRNDPRLQ